MPLFNSISLRQLSFTALVVFVAGLVMAAVLNVFEQRDEETKQEGASPRPHTE